MRGFTVSGTSGVGIDVRDSSHVTVTGNRVTRSGRRAKGGTAQGIRLTGTDDSVVFHNATFDNSEAGIALTGGSTRNRVSGNRSYGNARGYTRAAPGIDVRAPGNQVVGNLSYHNEDSGIQSYTPAARTPWSPATSPGTTATTASTTSTCPASGSSATPCSTT